MNFSSPPHIRIVICLTTQCAPAGSVAQIQPVGYFCLTSCLHHKSCKSTVQLLHGLVPSPDPNMLRAYCLELPFNPCRTESTLCTKPEGGQAWKCEVLPVNLRILSCN